MHHPVAPGRILALDAALGPCSAAVVCGGIVHAFRPSDAVRGAPAILPILVAAVLSDAPGAFDAVAVTVGPGSFTGLRAALALAHGLALGAGVPVVGVTVAEAIMAMLPDETLPAWIATDTRRGRVFLSRPGSVAAYAMGDLPLPAGPVAMAGDAAEATTAQLTARGAEVKLTSVRGPDARGAGLAGALRLAGRLPAREAQPLYVDPPEARLPARTRPAPA